MSDQMVWTKEAILEHVQQGSRQCFQDILARLLAMGPSNEEMKRFAAKSPDRWAQSVLFYAKMAGFHEKVELGGTMGLLDLARLSDAEIQKRLGEVRAEMAALPSAVDADASNGRPTG